MHRQQEKGNVNMCALVIGRLLGEAMLRHMENKKAELTTVPKSKDYLIHDGGGYQAVDGGYPAWIRSSS